MDWLWLVIVALLEFLIFTFLNVFLSRVYTFEPRHDKMSVRPAKTRSNLSVRPVWSESSLCAQWVAKDPIFLHADNEDSDQTGRMPRLIWVFVGLTAILLVLSCRGSFRFLYFYRTEGISWGLKVNANEQNILFSSRNCENNIHFAPSKGFIHIANKAYLQNLIC